MRREAGKSLIEEEAREDQSYVRKICVNVQSMFTEGAKQIPYIKGKLAVSVQALNINSGLTR
jgi:hypothetical protein